MTTAVVAAVMIIGVAYFVYVFGLRGHHHHVALASIIGGVWLVVSAVAYSFVYRAQMAAARRV